MKTLFLILFNFFILLFTNEIKATEIQNASQTEKNNCKNKTPTLKTERIEKDRKFLFWRLPHKKIIVIDEVLDSERNIILKRKSIYICSADACDDRKFRRIKIVDNEIWIFRTYRNYEKSIIEQYDFCGKYVGKKDWTEESLYNE